MKLGILGVLVSVLGGKSPVRAGHSPSTRYCLGVSIAPQMEHGSRNRVQAYDYAPPANSNILFEGVLAGIASVGNPFLGFGDRSVLGWPSASFARDWSALSHDFWTALREYTVTPGQWDEQQLEPDPRVR